MWANGPQSAGIKVSHSFARIADSMTSELRIEDGSRIAVIGGGPAGSFFSYFFLQMTKRVGLDCPVDIYEGRDFSCAGPKGCNMCGGIISESLAQNLAAEGINLPPTVVQRGIDSYVLHMDVGSVRIETPLQEMRIAAVHRGGGPRGFHGELRYRGLDGYLQELAEESGAHLIPKKTESLSWDDSRPRIRAQDGAEQTYDLAVVAAGVNSPILKHLQERLPDYRPPVSTKTYICELCLGHEAIHKHLGSSMHVFLLDIPRLEFAALIPKGEFVTLCLLGRDIDRQLVQSFMDSPSVRAVLPPGWMAPADYCHCSPRICVERAHQPFADRVVFVGDCGVTRLYKDGIGAAYRTAKAAAVTAVFEGISEKDFQRSYWPACEYLSTDNHIGEIVFAITRQIQARKYLRRGLRRMVSGEQRKAGNERRMSMVLWDTFTGSAPYRSVFLRSLHPSFWGRFLWDIVAENLSRERSV
jgi:flavin-dependent dehydrogenase